MYNSTVFQLIVAWIEREFDAYKLPRCMCITVSEIERDIGKNNGQKAGFFHTILAFNDPVRGVLVGISVPPLVQKN